MARLKVPSNDFITYHFNCLFPRSKKLSSVLLQFTLCYIIIVGIEDFKRKVIIIYPCVKSKYQVLSGPLATKRIEQTIPLSVVKSAWQRRSFSIQKILSFLHHSEYRVLCIRNNYLRFFKPVFSIEYISYLPVYISLLTYFYSGETHILS